MEFFYINEQDVRVTNYSYKDFDKIIYDYGFKQSNNPDFHTYFNWAEIPNWKFDYERYSEILLTDIFKKAVLELGTLSFIVRITHDKPLLEINSLRLSEILDDLCYEAFSMGWEAISTDGKYILEFTNDHEHLVISNFKILL